MERIALALSGGGFRAALFHIGSLWRLNELGYLRRLSTITSVSGGSIAAGHLALHWPRLQFDARGVARNYVELIAEPLRIFCRQTVDVPVIAANVFLTLLGVTPSALAAAYDRLLYHNARLADLPAAGAGTPRFKFYATSLQTGSRVLISREALSDYQVGYVDAPPILLSQAVAASSAYPPFLAPAAIRVPATSWKRHPKAGLSELFEQAAYRRPLLLVDGGIYDNLGVDDLWDEHETILASDAGSPSVPAPRPGPQWVAQGWRVLGVMYQQVQSLEKRRLIGDHFEAECAVHKRTGAYWGVASEIDSYGISDALTSDWDETAKLGQLPTRLSRYPERTSGELINWGYALCDVALRRWVDKTLPPPSGWPIAGCEL